ncbi:MAG TPA: VanW family protein [Candidatus Limnocylindria bacterium]|nr:VanW family protein [Candidatus Limnocylindria bacterium]
MRKASVPALLLCLLLAFGAAGESVIPPNPAKYAAKLRDGAAVYEEMSTESARLGILKAGAPVEILGVEPDWLLVAYKAQQGFIRRARVDDTSVVPLDPADTPEYPAVQCGFVAWASGTAPVLDAPREDAKTLVTLHEGARVAVADVTDGWARLVYHRQWAYISTLDLKEILPVNHAQYPDSDAPIAAYTSFYKLTSDESNRNRIVNLKVACERMAPLTLMPGDTLDFNADVGPWSKRNGYLRANVIVLGEIVQGYGGGTCQVSSTLYNVVLQLPGISVVRRRAHGIDGAAYLPPGADAAVGSDQQNFIIRNQYPFPVRIDGTVQDGALTLAVYRAD